MYALLQRLKKNRSETQETQPSAEEGAKPVPQPVAPADVRGKHLIESMDDALGQGSSRWVPNQRSQQTCEVEETVGDHHQQEQDKMEEQQKTEQKEEREWMAEMRAFESSWCTEKCFLRCTENKMDVVVVCTPTKR